MTTATNPTPQVFLDDDGFPLSQFEIDQIKHARVTQGDTIKERRRLRKANSAKGFAEPQIGQKYYVQLDSSVVRRTRAGMRFERGVRFELTVVSDEDFEAAPDAAPVITVLGAEHIIEDTALHVTERPLDTFDVDELRAERDQAAAAAAQADEENRKLRAELAAMKASRATPDSPTGGAAKLAARTAAKGEAMPEFGATPDASKK